jgi:DNA-binding PadR family transcriptional regulator
MARWRRTNPLALAVLVTLFDQPRHAYEIAQTMKMRGNDQSMRLNFGSLYSVVAALEREGFIEAVEVERQGKRPERTVYRVTDDGVAEARDWLADLLSNPTKEYPSFAAALSLLGAMQPDDVVRLLEHRRRRLETQIAQSVATRAAVAAQFRIPRLFLVEVEYEEAMLRAELAFVEQLLGELADGTFPDLDQWREWSTLASPVPHHLTDPERSTPS